MNGIFADQDTNIGCSHHENEQQYHIEGGRPRMDPKKGKVVTYGSGSGRCNRLTNVLQKSEFKPGDSVYLTLPRHRGPLGPYRVASVPSVGVYILSDENGDNINNATQYAESSLRRE